MDRLRSVDPAAAAQGLSDTTAVGSARQHGDTSDSHVLLNPFCPLSTAKVLALKATVLLLQTLVFLAISGGWVLTAGEAALYATQQRRPAA